MLPQQVLRSYEPDEFSTSINGVDDGRRVDTLMRWKLPVCVDCNGWLARTYEDQVKRFVPTLFGAEGDSAIRSVSLNDLEARAFTRWAMKTLLLMRHPQTRRRWAGKSARVTDAWPIEDAQMRAWRLSSELPAGLRLWIARTDPLRGNVEMVRGPQRLIPDSSHATFVGLGTGGGSELLMSLGWHIPDRRGHPMAHAGLTWELSPQAHGPLDLASLPLLNAPGRAQFLRGFVIDKRSTSTINSEPASLV